MTINYDAIAHHYYDDDGDYTSVTSLVGRFFTTFDSLKVSAQYALTHGQTAEYWREHWAEISKASQEYGKKIHADLCEDVMCGLFLCETYFNDFTPAGCGFRKSMYDKFGKNFDAISFKNEEIVFSKEHRVAGTYDLLLNFVINGELKNVLVDFKTGKNIDLFGYDNEIASPPFFFVPASKYGKSAMQMGFYSDLLAGEGTNVDICLIAHVTDKEDAEGMTEVNLIDVTEMAKVCKISEAKKYAVKRNNK